MHKGVIRTWSLIAAAVFLLAVVELGFAESAATIDWSSVQQTMDGWGGEDWLNGNTGYQFTPSQADMFFSPTAGIGLEYIRTQNFGCPDTGSCAVSTSNVPDLVSLQEAAARGAKIQINLFPPANLQYTGTFYGGADPSTDLCVDSSNWSAFATYTVNWIEMLNANRAPVSVLSVANEGNLTYGSTGNGMGECHWTAAGLDGYISGYLGPALSSAGLLKSVQVMMPEGSGWFGTVANLASTCLNDSTCAQYVSIVAGHGYGVGGVDGTDNGYCCATATDPGSPITNKRIWMSEVNGGFTYNSTAGLWNWDPSMADALIWAKNIHDYLTVAGVSGWEYWELADCCTDITGAPLNDGLTDGKFNTSKRYYVVGQWSKFVRSGWHRVAVDNSGPLLITAFQSPDGTQSAVVAVNNTASSSDQVLSVGTEMGGSVVPWITSATQSLAQQSPVTVGGGTVSYTIPADSVVTFVSNNSLAPPTGLTAVAH